MESGRFRIWVRKPCTATLPSIRRYALQIKLRLSLNRLSSSDLAPLHANLDGYWPKLCIKCGLTKEGGESWFSGSFAGSPGLRTYSGHFYTNGPRTSVTYREVKGKGIIEDQVQKVKA